MFLLSRCPSKHSSGKTLFAHELVSHSAVIPGTAEGMLVTQAAFHRDPRLLPAGFRGHVIHLAGHAIRRGMWLAGDMHHVVDIAQVELRLFVVEAGNDGFD